MTNLATRWTLLDPACSDVASAMGRRLRNPISKPLEKAVHEWENEGGNVAPSADALDHGSDFIRPMIMTADQHVVQTQGEETHVSPTPQAAKEKA